jgi:predicted nucleic acid-binding protein
MTVVVADTSPLNYLVLIDAVDILPRLYGSVTIPDIVLSELSDAMHWVHVRVPPTNHHSALAHLDIGECAAILVAQLEGDVLLLIDEAAGRAEASRCGIPNTGTPGVAEHRSRVWAAAV